MMTSIPSAAIISTAFFVLIFLSGFWVSRAGSPPPGLRLNVHKLIALAAAVFLIVTARRVTKESPLTSTETAAIIVAGLVFLATGITGGLASIDKPLPRLVTTLHRVLPYLTLLSTAASLYLLLFVR
jgi:ABC-type multidrug transport system permease subunit